MPIVLVGAALTTDADTVAALHYLENAGVLQVSAMIGAASASPPGSSVPFSRATSYATLDAVEAPPDSLVVLATPPRLHAAQASAAMKRGWHVLCATPLAGSVHDANVMMAAAVRHERLLAADALRRFLPAASLLRSLCHDQLLGPLFRFNIHEGNPPPRRDCPPDARARDESPDGVLLEQGTRILDLLAWCVGPTSLLRYADDSMGGAEANALLDLAGPEGVHGAIHLSASWPTSNTWQFIFERGIVRWDVGTGSRLTLQLASAPAALEGVLTAPLSVDETQPRPVPLPSRSEAIAAQLRHVLAAAAGRESLRFPLADAVKSLALVEECHARRTLLDQPWLSRNETARARTLSTPSGIRRP